MLTAVLCWAVLAICAPQPAFTQSNIPDDLVITLPPLAQNDIDHIDIDVGKTAVLLTERGQELSVTEAMRSDDWFKMNSPLIDGTFQARDYVPKAVYNTGVPTWVYFEIKNPSDAARTIIIDTQRPDLRQIDFYKTTPQQSANTQSYSDPPILSLTDKTPFSARPIKHVDYALSLELMPQEHIGLYLRYLRTSTEPMWMKAYSQSQFTIKTRKKDMWAAGFLSALAMLIVMTALGMPALGWRISTAYMVYVGSVMLWFFGITRHFTLLITPEIPEIANRMSDALFPMAFIGFFAMGRILFRFNKINRFYDALLLTVMAADFICAILLLCFNVFDTPWLSSLLANLSNISCLLYVANGIIAVRAKRDGSRIMLIGSLSLLAAFGWYHYVTQMMAVNGPTFYLDRLWLIPHVSIVEVSCFTLATIQAQIGIKRQRDSARTAEFKAVKEKLRLTQELTESERAYEKARRLAQLRQQKLTLASHDILQPLYSLRQAASIIRTSDPDRAREMESAFDYLETLARDSLAPAAHGSHEDGGDEVSALSTETFNAKVITESIYAMFHREAEAKGLTLAHSGQECSITSSPIELMRVVSNLTSNALKHTKAGHIDIRCAQDNGRVKICVEDTGAGMSEDELRTYLEPRQKGPNSKGAGLGLHQVKTACEKLGHVFEITSTPQIGTAACIYI